jgi:hypothetical protein
LLSLNDGKPILHRYLRRRSSAVSPSPLFG